MPLCQKVSSVVPSPESSPPLQADSAPIDITATAPTATCFLMLRVFIIERLSKVSTTMSKVIRMIRSLGSTVCSAQVVLHNKYEIE
ncbi:hypothetical protein GCM10027029_13300 [Conyzicola lurida]